MRRPPPRIITELITLTRADGRSMSELARELGVDETTLMHYWSGRRPISMKSYARIMKRFGGHRIIRDLALHYAAVEYHVVGEEAKQPIDQAPSLPSSVASLLSKYNEHFAEESIHGGRGLYLIGSDRTLSAAVRYVLQLFESARVPVCAMPANKKPGASESRRALASPLLVVERIEFICNDVASVLSKRADLVRPTIVTSTKEVGSIADAYLRRILTSTTRRVQIEETSDRPENSPQQHAAR